MLATFLLLLALVTMAGIDATTRWLAGSDADAGREVSVQTRTVTVEPGQTLWGIAARVAPGADVRATVDHILELNGLARAGDLAAGQSLVVPVSGRG